MICDWTCQSHAMREANDREAMRNKTSIGASTAAKSEGRAPPLGHPRCVLHVSPMSCRFVRRCSVFEGCWTCFAPLLGLREASVVTAGFPSGFWSKRTPREVKRQFFSARRFSFGFSSTFDFRRCFLDFGPWRGPIRDMGPSKTDPG